MTTEITIVVADDHPVFRKGLKDVIAADPMVRIVGEAGNGQEALKVISELQPSVAILDVDMPEMSGLDVTRSLQETHARTDIILLTMYKEEDLFNEAMDLGVMGYILKESASSEILESIRMVASGKHFVSARMSEFLLSRSDRARTLARRLPGLEQLTTAERRVLKLISESKTSKEIADLLHISVKTVENHRSNIATKLDLRGSHSLLKFALENKSAL